jgi:hypothetical protein
MWVFPVETYIYPAINRSASGAIILVVLLSYYIMTNTVIVPLKLLQQPLYD